MFFKKEKDFHLQYTWRVTVCSALKWLVSVLTAQERDFPLYVLLRVKDSWAVVVACCTPSSFHVYWVIVSLGAEQVNVDVTFSETGAFDTETGIVTKKIKY